MKRIRAFLIVGVILVLGSCGADSSFNQLFTQDGSDERLDVLYEKGRILYNQGDYKEAAEALALATEKYPASQKVAILSSFAELGAVGLSLFDIVKVVTYGESDIEKETDPKIKECAALTELIAVSGNDRSTPGKLDCLLGLDPDEDFFDGSDIAELRKSKPVLQAITKVVNNMCGFFPVPVDGQDGLRQSDWARHDCTQKAELEDGDIRNKGKIVWALAHLFEATILNVQANSLEKDAANLGQPKEGEDFSAQLKKLGDVVSAASTTASFIDEALYNLDTVLTTLGDALPGNSDLGNLEDAQTKLRAGVEQSFGDKESGETGSVINKVDNAISGRADEISGYNDQQKSDLCEGYANLGGDVSTLPSGSGLPCNP